MDTITDTVYFLEYGCELIGSTLSRYDAESWVEEDDFRSVTKVDYILNDLGQRVICQIDDMDFETFVRTRLVAQPYRIMRYLEILFEYRDIV